MITIRGAGFGLYGYLPAVIEYGVVLPRRYKEKLAQMPQARVLADQVRWVADDRTAQEQADTMIIAVPPEHQPRVARAALVLPNIERLILEKPLATVPAAALELLDELEHSGKEFRIGYLFRFTDWGQRLLQGKFEEKVTIEWHFMAHHFKHQLNNWRRDEAAGGGALRFYGIHLLALLAEMGYSKVIASETNEESSRWEAKLTSSHQPDCYLLVDTRATENKFVVTADGTTLANQPGVFSPTDPTFDSRVPVLVKLYASFAEERPGWYRSVILLWQGCRPAERSDMYAS